MVIWFCEPFPCNSEHCRLCDPSCLVELCSCVHTSSMINFAMQGDIVIYTGWTFLVLHKSLTLVDPSFSRIVSLRNKSKLPASTCACRPHECVEMLIIACTVEFVYTQSHNDRVASRTFLDRRFNFGMSSSWFECIAWCPRSNSECWTTLKLTFILVNHGTHVEVVYWNAKFLDELLTSPKSLFNFKVTTTKVLGVTVSKVKVGCNCK